MVDKIFIVLSFITISKYYAYHIYKQIFVYPSPTFGIEIVPLYPNYHYIIMFYISYFNYNLLTPFLAPPSALPENKYSPKAEALWMLGAWNHFQSTILLIFYVEVKRKRSGSCRKINGRSTCCCLIIKFTNCRIHPVTLHPQKSWHYTFFNFILFT